MCNLSFRTIINIINKEVKFMVLYKDLKNIYGLIRDKGEITYEDILEILKIPASLLTDSLTELLSIGLVNYDKATDSFKLRPKT